MTSAAVADYCDFKTLAAVIAHSQIVVREVGAARQMPPGYEGVDLAVLEWIAAEGRRAGRSYMPM